MTYSDRRELRERVWRMFVNRGDNGDKNDNNAIIPEILQLRAERAKLLGYQTHAHWRLENAMAKTPERAMQLMEAVWKPAVARSGRRSRHAGVDDKEGAIQIEPWDYRYYARRCAARATISSERGQAVPATRQLREGMSGSRENCSFHFTPYERPRLPP